MAILSTFTRLAPNQKLMLGGGLVVWGALGLATLPATEQALDLKPDPKETERLTKALPKIRADDLSDLDLDREKSPLVK